MRLNRHCLGAVLLFAAGAASPAQASGPVQWHEDTLGRIMAATPDPSDAAASFAFVIANLPDAITVYPSEGYYYFDYYHNGDAVRGNLRFDAADRDAGLVHFAHFYASDPGDVDREGETDGGRSWGTADGVELVRLAPLRYRLSYRGKIVAVNIYDAAAERSAPPSLKADEVFVGPVFDDSGIRFNLIYHRKARAFAYLLNPVAGPAESYQAVTLDGNATPLLAGLRSRYVYLREPSDGETNGRLMLVGVSLRNVIGNTHYDGPFDQLPDSFVDGTELQAMIEDYDPVTKGRIGPFGQFLESDSTRYAIAPYVQYAGFGQLAAIAGCPVDGAQNQALFSCLKAQTRQIMTD
jgi:hypothetical protein